MTKRRTSGSSKWCSECEIRIRRPASVTGVGPIDVSEGDEICGTTGVMPDILTVHAQVQPDKAAVIDDRAHGPTTVLSYAALELRASRLGRLLLDLGLSAPDGKVVWCGPNSPGLVVMINAARKIGVTAVPLNYRLSDDEAAYVIDHSDATVVYIDAEHASMIQRIRSAIPKVEHVLVFDGRVPDGCIDADVECARIAITDVTDPIEVGATMIYTSGTTGKPKGALRRGSGDPAQTAALLSLIGYTPNDIYIPTGPLYHSGPLGFMGIAQALGQTIVLQRKFEPEDWLRLVTTHSVTSTFSAPTPIRMICSLSADVKARYDTSSMKRMIANAAPWSFALKRLYLADFPPDSLYEVYGSTELGVNCLLRPEDQLRKPGSCGLACPMVDIKLFDDDGNEVLGFGPENTGELFVKSPAVFADYYKQHENYLADQRQGYQTVGDIAYRDEEGFVYICDRKKDMIISGGMNIYPAEIEAALEAHVDVYEAAVFGIPSDEWGEIVHAVVVKRPDSDVSESDLDAHARGNLASYKIPRSYSWSDELPKTGSGKILKRQMRDPFWAGQSSRI